MKTKFANLLTFPSLSILFTLVAFVLFNYTDAQNLYKRNRGENETCRKISQTLWKAKTAKGSKQQEYLIYEVGRLQKLLNKLGYYGPKPDYGENFDLGYFDVSTVNAVKKYQEANIPWIKANGSVNAKTLEFINKYEFCNSDRRFAQLVFDKTFTISGSGFSFKYPSREFKWSTAVVNNEVAKLNTYLDVCHVDEYANKELAKRTLCYKGKREGSFLGGALTVDILKDKKTSTECLKPDPKAVKDPEAEAYTMINGFKFANFKTVKKEVGHEITYDTFRFFKNSKCYDFKLNLEIGKLGTVTQDDDLINALDMANGKMRAALETIEFKK